ncbi:hypothetical protein GCM10023346_48770 [Arthrobacter gyeryongensis]|uniref:HTH lacI-type domain-containing protein n=1 Tax=Arthrobacter gyeryongensis TaxID=1650592 RepID=A0ABP8VD20_9MICC
MRRAYYEISDENHRMQMSTKKARLRDVAELAGVSATTVSNVVNERGNVAEATRVRVQKILNEVGYEKDEHALALRGRRPARRLSPDNYGPAESSGGQDPVDEGQGEAGTNPSFRFTVGDRIRFQTGMYSVSGVIDDLMPDGSGFWIRCDGVGRKFLALPDERLVPAEPS